MTGFMEVEVRRKEGLAATKGISESRVGVVS